MAKEKTQLTESEGALHKRTIKTHSFGVQEKIFRECITYERVRNNAYHVRLDGSGCWICAYTGAHRFFYETFVGLIPSKPHYDVVQSCGNKHCVNPDHLVAILPRFNPFRKAAMEKVKQQRRERLESAEHERKLQERYNRKAYCDICQYPMTAYNTLPGGRCRKCVTAEVKAAVKVKKEAARAEREAKLTRAKEWLAAQDAARERGAASGSGSGTTRVAAQQASENGAAAAAVAPVAAASDPEPAIEWPAELMSEA